LICSRKGRDGSIRFPRCAPTLATAALVCSLTWGIAAGPAIAGGGPENVLLLVNLNSDSSKTIANHYIELRKIPPVNVVYIDWKGGLETCNAKIFVSQVLQPAIKAIENRRLAAQIDYLVYSSDFPWRVELKPLFPDEKFVENFQPIGSLTGVTYLAPYVMGEKPNPAVVMPSVNWYVPKPNEKNLLTCAEIGDVPSRGFRSRYLWDRSGERTQVDRQGQQYLLSTCLGVTQGRANTVAEVIAYLKRAKEADGTRPRGTIYFMRNNNIRSQTRHACFAGAAAAIEREGVQARVLEGTIPRGARDVMAIMAGTDTFDIAAANNVILPGAICEHLTSAGGILSTRGYQTPLTDFLRQGAAGASGTVVEPHAIQAKFPLPSLPLHYVRGCSLAESFYQSISGPYQLLIVGDPLCQPWATFPTVAMQGIQPDQEVSGTVNLTLSGKPAAGHKLNALELFVDGRLIARAIEGNPVTLNTTNLADGYHELRVVGAHDDAIETRGRTVVPFLVNNGKAPLEFAVTPHGDVAADAKLNVKVRQPGATGFIIRQNNRVVGRVAGEAGEVAIQASTLGRGPTSLQAVSEGPAPAISRPMAMNAR
jgi:uncharacterized protein (TIGR03790 family)